MTLTIRDNQLVRECGHEAREAHDTHLDSAHYAGSPLCDEACAVTLQCRDHSLCPRYTPVPAEDVLRLIEVAQIVVLEAIGSRHRFGGLGVDIGHLAQALHRLEGDTP